MIDDKDIEKLKGVFATKDDLKNFATKDDLKNFATKDDFYELKGEVNELKGEVGELKEDVSSLREGQQQILTILDGMAQKMNIDTHERKATEMKVERHEGWIKKIAEETKVELEA